MHAPVRILVVAATARELAEPDGWETLVCGVGPVESAAATAAAIVRRPPDLILHVGIAGARRSTRLVPPQLVIGDRSCYCDLLVPDRLAPRLLATSAPLVAAAVRALPGAVVCTIGTSAHVGGTQHAARAVAVGESSVAKASDANVDTAVDTVIDIPVEAMEGFGVLRAAQLAGVPAIEVRAISNAIEEPDRALWRFDEAFDAITAATPRLIAELYACLR